MLIGLSVSQCIADIAAGKVAEDEVAYIIAGTKFEDEAEVQDASVYYARLYWQDNAMKAVSVFARLWAKNQIMQPRLLDQPILVVSGGNWLECKQVHQIRRG